MCDQQTVNTVHDLHLNIHGIKLHICCDELKIIENIGRDFSYFRDQTFSLPDFHIRAYLKNDFQKKLPARFPWMKTRDFLCYEKKGVKNVLYSSGDMVILDYKKNIAEVISKNIGRLHELVFTLLLSITGELEEKQGFHRIHALGISRNGKGGLVLAPEGGGKTTLALGLLDSDDFKLISEDTPLLDRELFLYPFPLRIGVRSGTRLDIPSQYLRSFERIKHANKILIDIDFYGDKIERNHVPLSWVLYAKKPKNPQEVCTIKKMNRLSFFLALIKNLVVGKGVCQLKEFFIKKDFRDLCLKFAILKERLLISSKMAIKFKPYIFALSSDAKKNADMIGLFVQEFG
jgi:hypothetical protein